MASIRDQIQDALVTRLTAALPTWTVTRRTGRDALNDGTPVAIVAATGENLVSIDSMTFTKDLLVSVFIVGHIEDTDATTHNGNPLSYLDDLLTQVEAAIWAGGEITDLAEQINHAGSAWANPEDENTLEAELRMTVRYRHNIADPAVYDPTVIL